MKLPLARFSSLWHFPGWFPEFVIIRSSRIRSQIRLLALAGLVGIVAGVGAVGMVRRFEIASAYLRHIHGPTKQP